MKFVFMLY